jgi:hypothetical protein
MYQRNVIKTRKHDDTNLNKNIIKNYKKGIDIYHQCGNMVKSG